MKSKTKILLISAAAVVFVAMAVAIAFLLKENTDFRKESIALDQSTVSTSISETETQTTTKKPESTVTSAAETTETPTKEVSNTTKETAVVTAKPSLNLRSGPDVSSEKIGSIKTGETVEVLEYQGDSKEWANINVPRTDQKGWVAAEFLAPQGSDAAAKTTAIVTAKPSLNLRSDPDVSSKKIGSIKTGETVEVLEYQDDSKTWAYVYVPREDQRGWVAAEFLASQGSDAAAELTAAASTASAAKPTAPPVSNPSVPLSAFKAAPASDFNIRLGTTLLYSRNYLQIDSYLGNDEYIRLPSTFEGEQIKGVGYKAFNNSKVKGIIVPAGYMFLESNCFFECSSLETIVFEGEMDQIGSSFNTLPALKQISLPKGIKNLYGFTFMDCNALERVALPDTLEKIGSSAFCTGSKNLTVIMPSSVTYIDEDAFSTLFGDNQATIIAPSGSYAEEYAQKMIDAREKAAAQSSGSASGGNAYPGGNAAFPDYTRAAIQCPVCRGAKKVECTSCHGQGGSYSVKQAPNFGYGGASYTVEHRCVVCGGSGKIDCFHCFGTGYIQ